MGNRRKKSLSQKNDQSTTMRVLALVCLLFATAFAGTKRQQNNANFRKCQKAVEGTKLHWMCHCAEATKKNGGEMSSHCSAMKDVVIANQHQCAEFRTTFSDNYDMFFDDFNSDFIVNGAPQPSDADKEFFSKYC